MTESRRSELHDTVRHAGEQRASPVASDSGLPAGAPAGSPLHDAGRSIQRALDDLRVVSSAARHGDQLAAVIVDAHAAGFSRLLDLAKEPAAITDDAELAELLWVHESAGDGEAVDALGSRVDTLRGSIEQSGVPGLVDAADRLIEGLTELYGWALGRAVERLHDTGQGEALGAALEDPLITALLLAHGMHPAPLAERVEHILAACRTSLGDHAGTVELVEVSEADGRVRVNLSGGDEKQRWRTRLSIERTIRELVADVIDLQVDGAEAEPRTAPGATFIPLTSIGRRRSSRWTEVPGVAALVDGDVLQVAHEGVAYVACRVGGDFFVAVDPFTTNSLRLVATSPPAIEAGDGTRFEFTDSLATHIDGGILEVLVT